MNDNSQKGSIGTAISEATRKLIEEKKEEIYSDGFDNGASYQRDRDLEAAVMAFLELKIDDSDIYSLLERYFHVKQITDARTIIQNTKIDKQIQAVHKCLKLQGMENHEIIAFISDFKVREQLETNLSLCELAPEKVIAKLKKNR